MRFLVVIAAVQLTGNLLLGAVSLASSPHLERHIKAMLSQHATSYYRTGKFATPNNYEPLMPPDYDLLIKTEQEKSHITLYLLPKKGIVSRYRNGSEFPSYAVILYFDASTKRLMSVGCRTIRTKRYKIQSPMDCNEQGLMRVNALEGKWLTEEDIKWQEMLNQIVVIVAITLYAIGFVRYAWVRQLTYFILVFGLIILEIILIIMDANFRYW